MEQSRFRAKFISSSKDVGTRLVALMLIVGGIIGAALTTWFLNLAQSAVSFGGSLIYLFIFGWTALKGRDLWNGKPAGYRWAKILILAQIPRVITPGFSYWFYTGLSCPLDFQIGATLSSVPVTTDFNLGAGLNLLVRLNTDLASVGINLAAVAALVFLLVLSPQYAASKDDMINPA